MIFQQLMLEEFGYECQTTFWDDFTIAEAFGLESVRDTYNRAFDEWKSNVVYLTELVLVLNHKIWYLYKINEPLARLYDKLWREAHSYACNTLTGSDADYYYRVTD